MKKATVKKSKYGYPVEYVEHNLSTKDWSDLLDARAASIGDFSGRSLGRVKCYYTALRRKIDDKAVFNPGIPISGYKGKEAYLVHITPSVNAIGEMSAIIAVVAKNSIVKYFEVFGEYVRLEFYGDENWKAFYDYDLSRSGLGDSPLSGYISIENDDDESDVSPIPTPKNVKEPAFPDLDPTPPVVHTLQDVYNEVKSLHDDLTKFLNRYK